MSSFCCGLLKILIFGIQKIERLEFCMLESLELVVEETLNGLLNLIFVDLAGPFFVFCDFLR